MTRPFFTGICFLFGLTLVHAQSADRGPTPPSAAAQRAQFKGGIDVVALDVCVRDRDGHPTQGLKAEDFQILENDVPQQVALFATADRVPLAVALMIDNSRSMAGEPLDRAKTAGARFIEILRSTDLVEVMSFNDRVNLRYRLGTDHEQAKASLDAISATGATRLYEAVLVATRNLQRAQQQRRDEYRNVIIVLSDGEDTHSRLPFDDVLEQVRRSGVLVYTISLRMGRDVQNIAPLWQMALLAHDTGGRAIAIQDLAGLTRTYQEINVELVNLYRIGYVPTPPVRDGSWRKISVRVPTPTVVVRTRSGYYAPRSVTAAAQPPNR